VCVSWVIYLMVERKEKRAGSSLLLMMMSWDQSDRILEHPPLSSLENGRTDAPAARANLRDVSRFPKDSFYILLSRV
jgi:hypothetical protein